MSELSVSSREDGRFTVVDAAGDIDLISAPVLRNALDALFREGRQFFVIDLTEVGFLDSTGIGVLVGAQRAIRPRGGVVRIVCSEARVLRVFTITGLDQVFTIHNTLEQALASTEAPGQTP